MPLDHWLAFAAASLVMSAIPGPGVATIVGFAIGSGRRTALASVAGMAAGNATAMTVSLAGAGAILGTSALAFTILKWIGALYLIAVGLLAILRSGGGGPETAQVRPIGARAAFMTTLAVGTFHPKTILFFVAFAAQFIRPEEAFWSQAALLVVSYTVIAAVTDTLYALTASSASALIRRPAARTWAQRVGGGAVLTAGVVVALRR